MKKFLFTFFVFLLALAPTLAAESAENEPTTEAASVLEVDETDNPQTLQFFLGAPANELPREMNFEAEFFYQKLLERLNSDFAVADKVILLSVVALIFAIFFFIVALAVLFFIFQTKLNAQTQELKTLTREAREDCKKERELAEHNLQSIIDSEQQVLNDLKKAAEEKFQQKID